MFEKRFKSHHDVKSIIDEMRTKQVESSMDIQSVAEATTTIAKNNIKIAANTEEISSQTTYVQNMTEEMRDEVKEL